ncbi:MAG: transketolase [Alphaproteobacteria bacterium]|nr:transketolase [Alphaproteobacteria bacterium]
MKFTNEELIQMSNTVRYGALHAIRSASSGHLGIALGAADIITGLYAIHLNLPDDKFVLSAGHGSALLYSVLKLRGYDLPSLESFRKLGGLAGHPEVHTPGVSTTTGPLGQGIGNAVGMAFAAKIKNQDSKVYCLCGDGDLMEGVAQESIAVAGIYNLNNLILLWDDNGISIDGKALTDIDIPVRMRAAGWEVLKVDGHRFSEINAAIKWAKKSPRPVFIQCKTIIGLDSKAQGTAAAHGLEITTEELLELEKKFKNINGEKLWAKFPKIYENISTKEYLYKDVIYNYSDAEFISTRELSGQYLEKLLPIEPNLIGGSADLSDSTKTLVKSSREITASDFNGNFIHYGVREHAMAAIMNGLALGGLRPYGGTFLVFSDYMRPAMRLSALMGLPVIYILTHDSIAVGEDGPTHQPIEQLASLRLIPNMNVFRPCNAVEVAASWGMALAETNKPSCIILSRQKFKQIKTPDTAEISRGAYIIHENTKAKITLIATGSEVPLAIEVANKINARVVSMPCIEKFRLQDNEYKNKILSGCVIALEAGTTTNWYEFANAVVGIDSFGASATDTEVYKHFGFDADAIAQNIMKNFQ